MFDVAESKGANVSTEQTEIISVAAEVWQDRKPDLSTATVAEARRIADDEISA